MRLSPKNWAMLDKITLTKGLHASRGDGVCAMEAVAWIAGQPHSDHPAGVSPSIGAFLRAWNDALPTDTDRDRLLKPLLGELPGTANQNKEERRAFMAVDWLIRTATSDWLDFCGRQYREGTAALRSLPEIVDRPELIAATPILVDLAKAAAAARDAAWVATWVAVRDAARDAAWDAAQAAAWAAAQVATWDAARERFTLITSRLQASTVELVLRMCAA